MLANELEEVFWGNRNVLKLDCGGLHNSVNSQESLNCILHISDFYGTQVISK